MSMSDYEAIVIGGGHAGIEASLALARLGTATLLVTQNPDTIGKMSCNPAIGGLAKGNLVREIDALGGEMGILADSSSLQVRMLNRSRGPAVQAPRAQSDKALYAALARRSLESQPNLSILMDTVVDFITDASGSAIEGVVTERGRRIGARVVVLTTGTFMEASLFIGAWRGSGGRLGEPAALGLGRALRARGFPVGRLKTGTPARIAASSVDLSRLEPQMGELPPPRFSFLPVKVERPNLPCHVVYTNDATHAFIRSGLDRSPLFSGEIVGRGPRYCPSIEDKVVRFPDRNRHQVFVEPEGEGTDELYLNGLSSSLPEDVQEKFYRSLPGFEHAQIVRPAYAVEYDFLPPEGLFASLESKRMAGLFVAGQTNGTSGYEEAAAQGLMAGINARRYLDSAEPIVLDRGEAYIGVLIDDLVTLSPKEPYRMFTSRAERRLALRQDTADRRLTPISIRLGLADERRREAFDRRMRRIDEVASLLAARRISRTDLVQGGAAGAALDAHLGESFAAALKDPRVGALLDTPDSPGLQAHPSVQAAAGTLGTPAATTPASAGILDVLIPELSSLDPDAVLTAILDARYSGYLEKEERIAARVERSERARIPADISYDVMEGLSNEGREKLASVRPLTLGQASRIPGVRKSDIALLYVFLERRKTAASGLVGESADDAEI